MDSKVRRPSYAEANRSPDVDPEHPEHPEHPMFSNGSMISKEKPLSKEANFFAPDGCCLLDRDLDNQTEKLFYEFQKVPKWLGVLFDVSSPRSFLFLQYSWLVFLLAISAYSIVHDLYFLVTDFQANLAPSTMVVSAITFQASVSLLFSLHWQKTLSFHSFLHIYRHCQIRDVDELDQIYSIITVLVFFVAIWSGLLGKLVHPSFIRIFYYPELCYVRPFFFGIYLSIITYNLETYLCLTNAIHCELKKFNYKIAKLKGLASHLMREKLENLIYQHTKLTGCIKSMDELYKVYAFVVTACVIPLTIFELTLLLTRTTLLELMSRFSSLPTVGFCIFELYAIMYPSRLSEELGKSKSLLCMNENVWLPYEEDVNRIARTLAMHLEQPNLGVSLWGFTLVTKSLILTTVSAMMTCLAFFLDLRPKAEESSSMHCDCESSTLKPERLPVSMGT